MRTNPGKDLDMLIAKTVFNMDPCLCTEKQLDKWRQDETLQARSLGLEPKYPKRMTADGHCNRCDLPVLDSPKQQYSTRMTVAWYVVDHLRTLPGYEDMHLTDSDTSSTAVYAEYRGAWYCSMTFDNPDYGRRTYYAAGKTPEHAICALALEVVTGSWDSRRSKEWRR